MKNCLPYYKRYPRDFIEGTIALSFELKTTYSYILDLIYMQGGNLPDEPRYISGLLGCSMRKWKSLRNGLIEAGKIVSDGTHLTNYRAIIELETLTKLQDKQRENRSHPNKINGFHSPRFDQPEPEPEPYKKSATHLCDFDKKFDEFWSYYPKREGGNPKHPAKLKFITIVKQGADPDGIIAAAKSLALEHPVPTRFVPMAQTWLNQHRFEDVVDAVSNRSELEKAEEQARQRRLLAASRSTEENMQ